MFKGRFYDFEGIHCSGYLYSVKTSLKFCWDIKVKQMAQVLSKRI